MKIIVAHPGKQHSYKTAVAIKKYNYLEKYITTFYYKGSRKKINENLMKQSFFKRAWDRHCSDMDDCEVITFYSNLFYILSFLLRFDRSKKIYRKVNDLLSDLFGKKVAYYAIKHQVDAVIMYDTTCDKCFDILKKEAPNIIRIQDVSAINRIYMKSVYKQDMVNSPEYSEILMRERGFLFDSKNLNRWQREIENTDYFIVPSKIVMESLVFSGIDKENVFICPYGSNFYSIREKDYFENNKLNVIYVGNVTQMKGIFYLLDAFMELPESQFSLTIVGLVDMNNELIKKYSSKVYFTGYVSHERVKDYLKKSDIFVFPSLGDSFGLSVLEAMAFGLPVVCSDHAGAADAIKNGYNGFVVSKGSKNEIKEKLILCNNNRDLVRNMSHNALTTIKDYTWNNYEANIGKAIDSIKVRKDERLLK